MRGSHSPLALVLACGSLAGTSAGQVVPSGEMPELGDAVRLDVRVGEFGAERPMRALEPGMYGTRALGDTFDSEMTYGDSSAFNLEAWMSVTPLGQSVLANGLFQLAGSRFDALPIEAGANQFDNGDGTFTLVQSARVPALSDGFVPVGLIFGDPAMTPVDAFGWRFGPIADRDSNPDAYDPMLSAPFPPSGGFTVVGADIFVRDNGVLLGSASFGGLPFVGEAEVGYFVGVGNAAGSGIDEIIVQYLVQSSNAPTEVELSAVDACLNAMDGQLVVEIDARGLQALAVGGQFFLEYDESRLDFVSADPGDGPFTREVYEVVDEANGLIDYAVGVPDGDAGTAVPTTMARLTFDVLGNFCSVSDLVAFRASALPPSRITDGSGNDLGAALLDLGPVTADSIFPSASSPSAIAVNAEAGGCDAFVSVPPISAYDNCGVQSITNDWNGTSDASDVYPSGTTEVRWFVVDNCGNTTTLTQDITVNPVNTLEVAVELRDVSEGPGVAIDGDVGEWPSTLSNGVVSNGSDSLEVFSAWGGDGLYLAFVGNDATDGRVLNEDDQLSVNLGLAGNTEQVAWSQGFEDGSSGWFDGDSGWYGTTSVVMSGTNGIASSEGAQHAIFEGDPTSAHFSRFDGYRSTWTGNYSARVDVYLDTGWAAGDGFDYSVASNGSDGTHQRDFIFHVTKDTSSGNLIVAGSNNSNFAPREDLDTLSNNYVVSSSGWYTFEHRFRNDGGVLAVDLNLYDDAGTLLFTETRTTPADTIPAEVGGNRYAWFTFIDVTGGIAVDGHTLTINGGSDWRYAWDFISDSAQNAGPVGDPSGSGTPGDYWGDWRVGDDSAEVNETFGVPSGLTDFAPATTGIVQKTVVSGGSRVTEIFIPNAELFDGQNNWTAANRDLVRFMGTYTPDAGPNAFAYPAGGDFGDQSTYLEVAGTLGGTDLALDRCIQFELTTVTPGSPVIVDATLSFVNGLATATLEIPCGDYACITARDTLHTLRMRDSDDFGIVGTAWSADFTSGGMTDDDSLPGGNFNDDEFIDILDFGVFISQFGTDPGVAGGDTVCGTAAPDADASGNGHVGSEDFTFIGSQFLDMAEASCGSGMLVAGDGPGVASIDRRRAGGPVVSISTGELASMGMAHLATADLNGDGVLDQADIGAFFGGARPDHLADLNGDGVVDGLDVQAIALAFQTGDMSGDVNADGRLDLEDLVFVVRRVGTVIGG